MRIEYLLRLLPHIDPALAHSGVLRLLALTRAAQDDGFEGRRLRPGGRHAGIPGCGLRYDKPRSNANSLNTGSLIHKSINPSI